MNLSPREIEIKISFLYSNKNNPITNKTGQFSETWIRRYGAIIAISNENCLRNSLVIGLKIYFSMKASRIVMLFFC